MLLCGGTTWTDLISPPGCGSTTQSVEVLKMPRRLLSVPEAMACTGLGRSNFFNKIASGEIRSVKVGKRRLIPDTAIDEYIEGLEAESDASSGVA